ncbi:hypothetical protein BYT27DRAFT_7196083 [Phlegmacium glaucopus]|nr:hypothetical protein BYT27DRAFT_7196083 [Phlegmacium glaucopus]
MDMVHRNTLEDATIFNRPPTADSRLEKTRNSPQLNDDIDQDGRRIYKIYHIHNFGTVNMDSLNSHSITMENCANDNVRRVTYHRASEPNSDEIIHSQSHAVVNVPQTDSHPTCRTYIPFSMDYVVMLSWAGLAVACLAFFVIILPRLSSCGIGERI